MQLSDSRHWIAPDGMVHTYYFGLDRETMLDLRSRGYMMVSEYEARQRFDKLMSEGPHAGADIQWPSQNA